MNSKKKIIFFIVEGISDSEALGTILNRIFDRNTVYVEIMHGDITSDKKTKVENIASKIGNIVKKYAGNIFKNTDFLEVIHLIDTDGAFIPDSNIIEDLTYEKPLYSLTNIKTKYKNDIIIRNKRKSLIINKLSTLSKVWVTIPYRAFYMSCNLDHVLHNKINASDEEKEIDAHAFAKKYQNNLKGFLSYISDSEFSINTDYNESWKYIKKDLHSLERHTNFCIYFKDFCEKLLNKQ